MMPARTEHVRPTDPVRQIMAKLVATVGTGDSLLSVAQELVAGEIGAVVVEDAQGPTGVISERDVVTVDFAKGQNRVRARILSASDKEQKVELHADWPAKKTLHVLTVGVST